MVVNSIGTVLSTTERILNAAEILFSEQGFSGCSLREITQKAGVNLASVHYHFGSKDALFQSIFEKRLRPLIERSVASLQALPKENTLHDVVMAFVTPAWHQAQDPEGSGIRFVKLLGRALMEHQRFTSSSWVQECQDFLDLLQTRFHEVLPHVTSDVLLWRIHFSFGLMFQAFSGYDVLKLFVNRSIVSAKDPDAIVHYLVPFLEAGLQGT
jgi:AcrR family transcriptional regulator